MNNLPEYSAIYAHEWTDPILHLPDDWTPPGVKVAEKLQVVRRGSSCGVLYIDGEPFGYATNDGFHTLFGGRVKLPGVTLTVVGYRLEVLSDIGWKPPGQQVPRPASRPVDSESRTEDK